MVLRVAVEVDYDSQTSTGLGRGRHADSLTALADIVSLRPHRSRCRSILPSQAKPNYRTNRNSLSRRMERSQGQHSGEDRSEEHTSELQSRQYLLLSPTALSSDLGRSIFPSQEKPNYRTNRNSLSRRMERSQGQHSGED